MTDPAIQDLPAVYEGPSPGAPADRKMLGLPEAVPPDWRAGFLRSFGLALKRSRPFRMALEVCNRCGLCADACPVYQESGDPRDIPAARMDLAGRIYARGFRQKWGKAVARRVKSGFPSEETLADWFRDFHRCLLCRRCAMVCPLGLDPSEVTLACREILADIGVTAEGATRAAASASVTGNRLGFGPDDWKDACRSLEDEVFGRTGIAVRMPVDEAGCDVLFLPATPDLGRHQGAMIGCAAAFHIAGVSWTTSTLTADAANHGWFLGYRHMRRINRRIMEAVEALKPKAIVWGESGHGWRVGRNFTDTLSGPLAGSKILRNKRPVHVCEYVLELLTKGAFDGRIDRGGNEGLIVTYHDPCQAARGAGLIEPPRRLLRASAPDFREMHPRTTGRMTVCCGGGGGRPWGDEVLLGSRRRAEAFAPVGANYIATICATCRETLPLVMERHLGTRVRSGSVLELFGRALLPYLTSLGRPDGEE